MTDQEVLSQLHGARWRLEKVLAEAEGDLAVVVDAAIRRTKLAAFMAAQPGFPVKVLPRAQGASPRPHDA